MLSFIKIKNMDSTKESASKGRQASCLQHAQQDDQLDQSVIRRVIFDDLITTILTHSNASAILAPTSPPNASQPATHIYNGRTGPKGSMAAHPE